jgi:hypothetical protein
VLRPLSTRGYAAWGFGFQVESDDSLLVEVVARCYRDLPEATDDVWVLRSERIGPSDSYLVTLHAPDGTSEELGAGRARNAVLELICWEVNSRALQSAFAQVVLHAAVVAGPAGAIAFCGASHRGKSTLAAAAARRGWRHLSDDMGLVDVAAMTVTPYARPIMLRSGGRDHLATLPEPPSEHLQFFPDEWFVPASELGATVADGSVPLVAVGFLEWHDGATISPLSRAQTLHDLTLHSATVARQGASGFARLERIARSVPGYRVGLGAADDVLDLCAGLVGPAVAQ